MSPLRPPVPRLAARGQEPVEGPDRGQVAAFFKQGRVDGARRLVDKALRVEHAEGFLLAAATRQRTSSKPSCTDILR